MATEFRRKVPRGFRRVLEARARPLGKQLERFFLRLARKEIKRVREAGFLSVRKNVQKIDDKDRKGLTRILTRQGERQAKDAASKAAKATGLDFEMSDSELAQLDKTKQQRAQLILDTTRERFDSAVDRVVADARIEDPAPSEREMSRRLQAAVVDQGPMSAERAEGIARTETTQSSNLGMFAALTALGAAALAEDKPQPKLQWVAVSDDRTRSTHIGLNGQTRNPGESFTSPSGAELRYPGDPGAPPEEVLNCRCLIIPVA